MTIYLIVELETVVDCRQESVIISMSKTGISGKYFPVVAEATKAKELYGSWGAAILSNIITAADTKVEIPEEIASNPESLRLHLSLITGEEWVVFSDRIVNEEKSDDVSG